jgi:nucleotide-binding universal stress UspA family protein
MYSTILLAAALQRWHHYSTHARAARELALIIARNASQRLHVLSVYDYGYQQRVTELPAEMIEDLYHEQRERIDKVMQHKIDDYITPLKEAGLQVTQILRVGKPREEIVQVANVIEADLLIIGSHSKRGILDIALGGTAQFVSRHAPCNVVLVSPKA